jgi:RNA polymerase sigma-70 factor, ECF subfamily
MATRGLPVYIRRSMNPPPQSHPYPNTMAAATPPSDARALGGDADLALVRRMHAGDQRALSEFYERWFPIVNCLVSRMLKSASDVEDVVEETFWQVWRQSDRFTEGRGSVQTWLLTIARSRSLDRLRSLKRLREESIDDVQTEAEVGSQDTTFASSATDPLLAAEHQERKALVLEALAELPREQREALELGYFAGLSQSEIAERLGQPLGTVKTRMRLAMMKLKDRLYLLREDAR